jgi:glutamyl-tRNA synthetase
VVDDIDMAITHVIRGDDHINNTPRQINIFRALGKEAPVYAHLPTVLNEQGEKMSKRHGAKAVTQYAAEGYLPDAMVNYLARLGWSHGDDEIFSREQFLKWFNLDHLGKSAAQFDEAKLRWVNAQHMKAMPDDKLAELVLPFLREAVRSAGPSQASTAPSGGSVLHEVKSVGAEHRLASLDAARRVHACALLKDRCSTLVELADWMSVLVTDEPVSAQDIRAHVPADIAPAVARLAELLASCEWSKAAIAAVIKQVLAEAGLKMPQLAMPVRVLIAGRQQTPSLDAFLALMDQENVIARLGRLKSI